MLFDLKNGAQLLQKKTHKHMKTLFIGSSYQRNVFMIKQKVFGQIWENSGKNPSHPQKFALSYRPTPMLALPTVFASDLAHY